MFSSLDRAETTLGIDHCMSDSPDYLRRLEWRLRMRLITLLCWMALCLEGATGVPAEVLACVHSAGSGYAIKSTLDPAFLRDDFDGDGKPDYAVLVERGRDRGILICLSSAAAPMVLGAGVTFHYMKNLDFTAWRVQLKSRRVGLLLEWESASAFVYWNGKRFIWYQQGD
jgi:hypothetical protein